MDWNQAVADIGPRLYRYFCATFSPEMAADLTQETLIRLVRKIDQFDSSRGSLLMYAYGFARLVRLEALKSRPPEEIDGVAVGLAVVGEVDELELQVARLRRSIAELSPVQQQIVLLLIDRDLSLKEIADSMALPLNTVKSHIHRAKESLRKIMTNEGAVHE